MMNIPNLLTILRILLVPVIAVLLMEGSYGTTVWLFLLAGFTDALDGYIARKLNQVTYLGSILDPVADKVLILTTVIILALSARIPWWVATAIILRDVIIIGGAVTWYLRTRKFEMDPSILSKVNTFLQIGLVYIMIAQLAGMLHFATWLPFLFLVVLVSTVGSGVHYILVWGRRLSLYEDACADTVNQE